MSRSDFCQLFARNVGIRLAVSKNVPSRGQQLYHSRTNGTMNLGEKFRAPVGERSRETAQHISFETLAIELDEVGPWHPPSRDEIVQTMDLDGDRPRAWFLQQRLARRRS